MRHYSDKVNSELLKERSDVLDQESRQAQEQLAEMARTATGYSELIKKKETEIARLMSDLDALADERELALKRVTQLQGEMGSVNAQLDAQKADSLRSTQSQARLQKELDELRALMQAKTSEESRRKEVEKSKEKELVDLRGQLLKLERDLSDSRQLAVETQNRLKADLEIALRETTSLQHDYQELVESEQANQSRRKQVESALADADRARRSLESELHLAKSRQTEVDSRFAEASKAKEVSFFPMIYNMT